MLAIVPQPRSLAVQELHSELRDAAFRERLGGLLALQRHRVPNSRNFPSRDAIRAFLQHLAERTLRNQHDLTSQPSALAYFSSVASMMSPRTSLCSMATMLDCCKLARRASWSCDIIVKRAKQAGISGAIMAHSIRAGYVTEALRRNLSITKIMDKTGHESLEMLRHYDRPEQAAEEDPTARLLE